MWETLLLDVPHCQLVSKNDVARLLKFIARLTSHIPDKGQVDIIINHLKLTFVADRASLPQLAYQEPLLAAESSADSFS